MCLCLQKFDLALTVGEHPDLANVERSGEGATVSLILGKGKQQFDVSIFIFLVIIVFLFIFFS